MASCPYIFRRGNVFYLRLSVPLKLQAVLNKREVVRSLDTEQRKEANLVGYKMVSDLHILFNRLEALMNDDNSYDELLNNILAAGERMLHAKRPKPGSLADLLAKKKHQIQKDLRIERLESEIESLKEQQQQLIQNERNKAVADAIGKLSEIKLVVGESPSEPTNVKSIKSPKLSKVIDDFLVRYDKQESPMMRKLIPNLKVLLELIGNKNIDLVLQADINNFFDLVQKLPIRRDSKEFKGKSLVEMIRSNTGACIARKTFESSYVATLSVFLSWGYTHYSDQGFKPLTVKGAVYRGSRVASENKQRAITGDELKAIFGHKSMKDYAYDPTCAHFYYLPLIGLYTGARLNEICQLNPSADIIKDADTGIWYFWFNDETETADDVAKSVKTKSSKRVVPIHSKLIELGFLEYVDRVKASGDKIIFPKWTPRNGRASENASKWFRRYIEAIGIKDVTSGKTLSGFHAFRHTFITYAINNKISGFEQITGHEADNIDGIGKVSDVVRGYYTTALTDNLKEKQAMIEKFDFGLEFCKPKII